MGTEKGTPSELDLKDHDFKCIENNSDELGDEMLLNEI